MWSGGEEVRGGEGVRGSRGGGGGLRLGRESSGYPPRFLTREDFGEREREEKKLSSGLIEKVVQLSFSCLKGAVQHSGSCDPARPGSARPAWPGRLDATWVESAVSAHLKLTN